MIDSAKHVQYNIKAKQFKLPNDASSYPEHLYNKMFGISERK